MDRIKVLIVDDSAVVRQTLKGLLDTDPEIEVIAVASDPIFAFRYINNDKPDVIISDVEMPRMDGLSFLRKIMETNPIPVVICSSKTEEGSDNAIKAMEFGAVEIIQKPKLGTRQFLEESKMAICDSVKAAYATKHKRPKMLLPLLEVSPKLSADVILAPADKNNHIDTTEKVVVVGASTGGTEALKEFLEALPENAPGIVIVQHMPENFTAAFARRLALICKLGVKEAENNDTVIPGRALIAPGNRHTLLKRSGTRYYVEIKDGPLVSRHRPSVDVLFRSAARYAGSNCVGVIMTGMGDDGARGMKELHDAKAWTIAQDEASCVVFGMPAEAIKHGGVDVILPLSKIPGEVLRATK